MVVRPAGGLLYHPEPAQTPDPPTAPFIEAEQAEFARKNLAEAEDLYFRLTSNPDVAVRAAAFAGLARVHRKAQQPDAALAAYDALAALSAVRVADLRQGWSPARATPGCSRTPADLPS